jgi:hypothetical protein
MKNMQITLNENEIKKAIVNYVGNRVDINGEMSVKIIAGRSPNGFSASIDIDDDGDYPTEPCCDEDIMEGPTDEESCTEPEEDVANDTAEESDESPLFGS